MNILFGLTWYETVCAAKGDFLEEKTGKLLSHVKILNACLGSHDYDEMAREAGAENAGRNEKIRVLNQALAPIAEIIGNSCEGLDIGRHSFDIKKRRGYWVYIANESMNGISTQINANSRNLFVFHSSTEYRNCVHKRAGWRKRRRQPKPNSNFPVAKSIWSFSPCLS
jgi:hypothetical protein